jgi:GntR family transcriptional regulator/MocR family aminotransferase
MVPVPVDQEGMRVEDGLAGAQSFASPRDPFSTSSRSGTVMSLERRFASHQAAAAGAWIIEVDVRRRVPFGGRPPPTLKSVDTTGLVIYVGTFSKSLFPSLRLGFILSPPSLTDSFRTIMNRLLTGVPTSSQATVAEFMEEGYFYTHVRRMRRLYAERNDVLCASARRKLQGLLRVAPASSGLHTIGYLEANLPESRVAAAAEARQITVSPISRFTIAPVRAHGLVLGFGGIKPSAIEAGVEVLAEVLGTCADRPLSSARRTSRLLQADR